MEGIKNPKVFISYAWTNPGYKERVNLFAQRLYEDYGIEIILDQWELIGGNDLYSFMERSVTDTSVDKVLILCNKEYTDRADKREGGAGAEAMIITPELYNSGPMQSRIIPVIFDESFSTPAYIKSKYYYDCSTDEEIENNIKDLVRCIYDKPLPKPKKLGPIPNFIIGDEDVFWGELKKHSVLLKIYNPLTKSQVINTAYLFSELLIDNLEKLAFGNSKDITNEMLEEKVNAMKPLRDVYLESLENIILKTDFGGSFVTITIEKLLQNIFSHPFATKFTTLYRSEHYHYFLWELLISSIAMFLVYDKLSEINNVLDHKYLCGERHMRYPGQDIDFPLLRQHLNLFNNKEAPGRGKYYSYASDVLIKREKKPAITADSLVAADIIMCQLSCIYYKWEKTSIWYPETLHYYRTDNKILHSFWNKLYSAKECEKLLPLFRARNIDELQQGIKDFEVPEGVIGITGGFVRLPNIADFIHFSSVASRG